MTRTACALLATALAFTASVSAAGLRALTEQDERDIDRLIERMTPAEKVGQLLMMGFVGDVDQLDQAETLIRDFHVGSLILFERNIHGMGEAEVGDTSVARRVAELTNALQQKAASTERKLPLLIAVDQENGSGLIVEKGVTLLPGAMGIAATGDPRNAYRAGEITGSELRAMGITMDLAPVADINTNEENDIIGDRAFGGSKQMVTDYAVQFMKGLRDAGVLSVAKHFPGHGFTDESPHELLPEALYREDQVAELTYPYEQLVREGVDGIMLAHIAFPELGLETKRIPFSLSQRAVQKWIRDQLGFDGVVVADDLAVMKAAALGAGSPHEAVRWAARAGNDILILVGVPLPEDRERIGPATPAMQGLTDVVESLTQVYAAGDGPERLDASVRRVLRLKKKVASQLLASAWLVVPEDAQFAVRTDGSLLAAREIADQSITLIRDGAALFADGSSPLQQVEIDRRILLCVPVFSRDDLTPEFTRRNRSVDTLELPYKQKKWSPELLRDKQQALDAQLARSPDLVIFGVVTKAHVELLDWLLERLKTLPSPPKLLIIAMRAPNLLDHRQISRATYLAAYSNLEVSNRALGRVLAGEVRPNVIDDLPVSIKGVYEVTDPIRNPTLVAEAPASVPESDATPPVGAPPPDTAAPAPTSAPETKPQRVDLVTPLVVMAAIVGLSVLAVIALSKWVFTSGSPMRPLVQLVALVVLVAVGAAVYQVISPDQLTEVFTKVVERAPDLSGGGDGS